MHVKDILPWNWGKHSVPVHRREGAGMRAPSDFLPGSARLPGFVDEFFRRAASHLPDSVWQERAGFLPALDAEENDREIRVQVELPGMTEKEIDLALENDTLVIRGEKREERERSERGGHWIERRFGSFQRAVPLPCEVDADAIEASFRSGVLTVVLQKRSSSAEPARPIQIRAE